ncbi:uncharacterized protein LOC105162328 [Sesamum indicum]|uniref:Uncharacterized protein LOC105162328 n=1 Tax=Sesamum indicum TaxID=4182 RepID=A0A6I9TDD5_SESIN|nr:uncharacterized protein LOC105162328 [Sesamum indicum]
MAELDLKVGMKFETRANFRDVLRDWAVRRGWDLKLVKNEKHLIIATCKNGCNWKLRASSVMKSTTFQIKSIKGEYTCARDVKEQYARLYDYFHTVVKHNPRSSIIMKLNKEVNPPVLQRMYFCLRGMRDGFIEGCRPLIGLDGCFLKGLFKGQLLAAIGRDPNDNIYLIAVAYVEVEKYDSWEWFLNLLLRDIGLQNERGWALISNRQKGLLEAIAELAPRAEHRFCLRHMYNNFKEKFKGQQLKKMFWKAASTYSVNQHLKTMAEIEKMYPKKDAEQTPYEWLAEIPPVHWARCFFPTKTKCDVLMNNMNESFDHIILEARELPIIQMFEWIRNKFMGRIQVKREGMEKYEGVVCPNTMKKTEVQRLESRNCFPYWAGEDKYEVMHFMQNHIVYLKEKFCSCGMFQLVGYPCCHVIAAIDYHRLKVEDFIDNVSRRKCI